MNSNRDTRSAAWQVIPVNGRVRLAGWQEPWRAALAEAATDRLFLEPEWVMPWLEQSEKAPRTLLAAEHGRVRAVAILVATGLGPPGARATVLRPPGLGVSDYLDLILPGDAGTAEAAVGALLDWLLQAGGWDLLDLPNLPGESPTADLLVAAAASRGLASFRIETNRRPFIKLDKEWESYLAGRPSKLRSNLRARQRRLAALGAVHYSHYTDSGDVAERLGQAVEVHSRRWRGQRTSATFSSSATARRFYIEAANRMAERGWLDLSMLELDGRLLAFCLGFVRDGKYYYYLPAFEPEYARFAPSTALLAHLIECAYRRGLGEFDFMLGDEPYKHQWANDERATTRLVVAAPGPRGYLALSAFKIYLSAREQARRSLQVQRARRYGLGWLRAVGGKQ